MNITLIDDGVPEIVEIFNISLAVPSSVIVPGNGINAIAVIIDTTGKYICY